VYPSGIDNTLPFIHFISISIDRSCKTSIDDELLGKRNWAFFNQIKSGGGTLFGFTMMNIESLEVHVLRQKRGIRN
jgi:hypothetical protein